MQTDSSEVVELDHLLQDASSTRSTPSGRLGRQAHWQALLQEQAQSGLRIKDFCEARGIHPSGFYAWRRKLKPAPQSAPTCAATSPGFVRLTATATATATQNMQRATIQLPNGIAIDLPVDSIASLWPTLREMV